MSEADVEDAALRGAARAGRPAKALRMLEEACIGGAWQPLAIERVTVVKHRPGSRMVLRYEVTGQRPGEPARPAAVFAKLYRSHKGMRVAGKLRALRELSGGAVRVPEVLGYAARWRLLVLEALEGPGLADVLRTATARRSIELLAAGLAALHAVEPPATPATTEQAGGGGPHPVWPVHDARAEIVVLDRAARRLRAAPFWPRIARSHAEAQDRVRSRLIEHAPTRVGHVVHRDLYAEQVRLVDGGVGFLDLDEASLGEPAIDLGNLVAHLEMADLQRDGSPGAGGALGGALVDAYRVRGAIDPGRLAVYRAATLLRLASLARVAERSRSVLPWQELAARLIGMAAS